MIDKTIDNYRITEVLGKGGMGIVYKAIDMDLETPVAIKMIDPVFSRDQTFLRRFKREAQGLAKASSFPGILGFGGTQSTSDCIHWVAIGN